MIATTNFAGLGLRRRRVIASSAVLHSIQTAADGGQRTGSVNVRDTHAALIRDTCKFECYDAMGGFNAERGLFYSVGATDIV